MNDDLRRMIRAEALAAQTAGRNLELAPELALRCLDWLVEAQARVAALDAEAAALRAAFVAYFEVADGPAEVEMAALATLESTDAGAALLAELEAARVVVGTSKEVMAGETSRSALTIALAAYDEAVKGAEGS